MIDKIRKKKASILKGALFALALLCMPVVFDQTDIYAAQESSTQEGQRDYKGKTVVLCTNPDKGKTDLIEKVNNLKSKYEGLGAEVITVVVRFDDNGETNIDVDGAVDSVISKAAAGNDIDALLGTIIEKGFSNVEIIVVDDDTEVEMYYDTERGDIEKDPAVVMEAMESIANVADEFVNADDTEAKEEAEEVKEETPEAKEEAAEETTEVKEEVKEEAPEDKEETKRRGGFVYKPGRCYETIRPAFDDIGS